MTPRILWIFWDTVPTTLIQNIKKHNLKILSTWDVRFLDDTTLHNYIPHFPEKVKTLSPQKKSDWIRLYLIMTYGGIWSDASIIYNDVNELDRLWEKSKIYDFIGFYNNPKKINNIYVNVESFFFISNKKGTLVTLWYKEFNKALEEGFLHYRNRILSEGRNLDEYYKKGLTDNTYFIVYMCLQNVLHTHKLPPLLLLPVSKSMYKISKTMCKHSRKLPNCIMNTLKRKPNLVKKIPFIKLTHLDRDTKININSYFKN